jgi:hypothetical protein
MITARARMLDLSNLNPGNAARDHFLNIQLSPIFTDDLDADLENDFEVDAVEEFEVTLEEDLIAILEDEISC